MFSKFLPDYYLPSSVELTPAFFLQKGIRAIISDIDNTLVTYDDPTPTKRVSEWLESMRLAGIQVLFVSNNNRARVEKFNAELGYYATAKSKKPSRRAIQAAIDASGLPKEAVCMLGDQIYTDIYAAKKCGIRAILVPPIKDKRDPFTRFKRLLERPILRKIRKLQAKKPPLHLAVLGDPVAHSRSPLLHATLSRLCKIPLTYEAIRTNEAELPARLEQLRQAGFIGVNCTMPLKTEAFALCDRRSQSCSTLQSVNTITLCPDGFFGESTDGIGFLRALAHHKVDIAGKKIVLLGAGGAARSVCDALLSAGALVQVFNRSEKMCGTMQAQILTPDALKEACADCDLLVQATSLGMAGQGDFDDLSFLDALSPHAVVADLAYNPLQTALLQKAQSCGLATIDGLWLLLYQGIASFTSWCGVAPSPEIAAQVHDVLKESFH
jgi:HAD superfamily phosphatase (TIGR01668 family)